MEIKLRSDTGFPGKSETTYVLDSTLSPIFAICRTIHKGKLIAETIAENPMECRDWFESDNGEKYLRKNLSTGLTIADR